MEVMKTHLQNTHEYFVYSSQAVNINMDSNKVRNLHWHLYPDHINKTRHPTGLDASSTKLTAYIGTWISFYGSVHGPITW